MSAIRFNIEGLREEIRHALLILPRTRGQLEGFENNGCSRKYAKKPEQPIRTIACRTLDRKSVV